MQPAYVCLYVYAARFAELCDAVDFSQNPKPKKKKCKIIFIEITILFKLMSYEFYFICRTLISHIKTVK